MEIEAGANQERNALNRIREARDSHHQDQLQKTLESIREDISTPSGEDISTPSGNDASAVHTPSGDTSISLTDGSGDVDPVSEHLRAREKRHLRQGVCPDGG
jgi:hypothetical protein